MIVAGFQGFSPDSRDITTLGRGGSDATAVALAATLGADVCEIYTDVDGVFTADPRLVPDATKLDEVTFAEMLELAGAGAGVLMARSVEFGRRYHIPIHVRSSFHDGEGTWVKETTMEEPIVTRGRHMTPTTPRSRSTACPTSPALPPAVFEPLADAGVNVDMIVQNVSTRRDHRHQLHGGQGAGGYRPSRHRGGCCGSRRHAASMSIPTSPRSRSSGPA